MTGCCFKVAPFGDDALAEESDGATPFLNVQAAIDFADEHRELGTRICVAGGHACQEVLYSGPSDADLRMRNGISVIGNHDPTSYTQCPGSVPVTILRPETAPGVVFESDVQDDTALEGFIIRPGFNGARTVGVTARGANGVRLGSLRIEDGPNTEWCGIDLVDTAAAIRDVSVYVQNTNKSVAVQAIGSSVYLEGTLDLRSLSSFFTGIWLENSPGSRIAADVTVSNAVPSSVTQAVRLTGDAEGTRISESSFAIASFAEETTGILIEDCAGASPFLNATIVVEASELGGTADGVRSRSCHPRIENSSIAVRGDRLRSLRGVACESGSSGGSRCILVNDQISTTKIGIPVSGMSGTGVFCDTGSCERIESSTIVGLELQPTSCHRNCDYQAIGVDLVNTNTRLHGNQIRAGCGDRAAGIRASGFSPEDPARIENNTVSGRTTTGECGTTLDDVVASAGLVSGGNLDVRSNTFDGGGSTMPVNSCWSAAVMGGLGAYVGNTFHGGVCPESLGFSNTTYPFVTQLSLGVPSTLAENDFVNTRYRTDFTTVLTTIEEINRLPYASGNY